jgi:hypothetical protein
MTEISEQSIKGKNHLLLRLVCVFAITYYAMASIILAIALFFNEFITGLSMQYLPELGLSRSQIILFLLAGLIMNVGAVYGSIMVLYQKIIGALIFSFSSLLIMGYQYVLSGTDGWHKYAVEGGLLVLFLLFLSFGFAKKLTQYPH